jgi:hypothetical protein
MRQVGHLMPISTVRSRTVEGAKLLGTLFQLCAPKCAICWSSFAGLWNATWFVAQTTNPWWVFFASLTAAVSLGVSFINAYRHRRYAAFALTTVAWLLLACGWLVGTSSTRYLGACLMLVSIAIGRQSARCGAALQTSSTPLGGCQKRAPT